MSAVPERRYTFEEYLRLDRDSPEKLQFHDGVIVPLAGASEAHHQILVNTAASLRSQLRGSTCRVYTEMRTWIPSQAQGLYPDVVLICGAREYHDKRRDTLLNPLVIIEVLSPSTEDYDHGTKFRLYRSIPSLREYVLISQHERLLERYSMEAPNSWRYEVLPSESRSLELLAVPYRLSLDEIYEEVDFQGA